MYRRAQEIKAEMKVNKAEEKTTGPVALLTWYLYDCWKHELLDR